MQIEKLERLCYYKGVEICRRLEYIAWIIHNNSFQCGQCCIVTCVFDTSYFHLIGEKIFIEKELQVC